MELIYLLDRGRLRRELRRREAALREAAKAPQAAEPKPESLLAQPEAAEKPQPVDPKSESPGAEDASMTRGWWNCDFCGRGFHGYGQFLNHKCDEDD